MQNFKLYLLVALLFQIASAAMAQTVYLEPRLGFGTFYMKSMKELQQKVIANTGLDAKAIDRFGPYFQFGFNAVSDIGDVNRIGIFVEHGSTGGRVSYADYSGEFKMDTPLSYNALGGLFYAHSQVGETKLSTVRGVELSFMMTRLKLQSSSQVYHMSESSEDKLNSYGLGIKPFVGLQYPVLNFLTTLSLGYLASISGPFHVPGDTEQQLVIDGTKGPMGPGWGGFRLNLGVSVPIVK